MVSRKLFYFMNLSPKEQQMYNAMYEAICKFNKEVRLEKSSNINELRRIVRALNYDNPQMFYVNLHQYQYILGDTYTKVFFEYYFEEKEAKRKIKKYKKEIKKLYVKCEEEISVKNDFYRCRWFHNYLTRNVYYDNEALIKTDKVNSAHTILGVLDKKKAVCEGIAKFYQLLCMYSGIECICVVGNANFCSDAEIGHSDKSSGHAWNMVCINGKHAHIDVTWDISLSQTSKFYRYDYFCIPDVDSCEDHIMESDWKYPKCNRNSGLNYFEDVGSLIKGLEHLRTYMKQELKKRPDYLYFKVYREPNLPNDLNEKIDEWFNCFLKKNLNCSWSYYSIINKEQLVFLYKLAYL